MPSTDISKLATCTTCTFADDLSNYWTANMYFKARNGTYMRVKQIPNRFLDGADAGMTVYYMSPGAGKVTAFQPVCISSSTPAGLLKFCGKFTR